MKTHFAIVPFVLILLMGCSSYNEVPVPDDDLGLPNSEACKIKVLEKSEIQGRKIPSPDGQRYLINKEDENGISQIYLGATGETELTCITCVQKEGGPKPERYKMQPHWHPSGDYIIMAAERDEYSPPFLLGWSDDYVEGQLQNGIWMDMYVVSLDGEHWSRLLDSSTEDGNPGGYTGPIFSSDGKKAVWSQIMDGNILEFWPFGKWELTMGNVHIDNGMLTITNRRDITPIGMHWNEPGNFAPDNETVLFSGSTEEDAQGMDQYTLNINTSELTNLTNTPDVWDEHGMFSPDGKKIIFMSAYPYRNDPNASKVATIKTEFMLMDSDGGNLSQLTHFREPGYPEYSDKGGIAANNYWSHDGSSAQLLRYFFPNLEYWDIQFEDQCGNQN